MSDHDEPIDAEAEERVWITVTIPQPGRREAAQAGSPIVGRRMLTWETTPDDALRLEKTLRSHNRRHRAGRPRLYVGDRYCEGQAGDDDDDGSASAVEIVGEAGAPDVASARAELGRLDAQIAEAREELRSLRARRNSEWDKLSKVEEVCVDRTIGIVKKCQDHASAQLTAAWELDARATDYRRQTLDSLAGGAQAIVQTRQALDQLLVADSWGSTIKEARAFIGEALDSPIGRVIGFGLSAGVTAKLSKVFGQPITPEDAAKAMLIHGGQYRDRLAAIHRLCANYPASGVAQGATLALQILDGDCELTALAERLDRGEDMPPMPP
ncbi:hypothetical protein [Nannocystis bainbridge]|uniref:Uncharacterized protein n=1 Tax=Nannocystis bainbridge TaxID=2995303 RepID=A0ABT5E477_9BACT|nr:hypothetical protein [Nannocystis bainbridge]MDC0720664.1 hypothetical protein [Nannocystis bainbridge]